MKLLRYFFTILILLLISQIYAQDTAIIREKPPPYDSLKLLYPFLNLEKNRIAGDTGSLAGFYQKLDRIKAGSREHAVVVHIGDSHVQPGIISLPLREWLQADFGNAGKGLMFPYRLAKSNGPAGYITRADTPWIAGRNATVKRPLPTGVAGFTLWSASPSASFTVEFTTPPGPPGDTARLIIFHERRDSCYFYSVSNEITGRIYPVCDTSQDQSSSFLLDDQPPKIRIKALRTRESQRSATFYGMSMESEFPGVIVHVIGVNGATYANYLESEHFASQLAMLNPDLLIVSLGTNEAFATKSFNSANFLDDVDSLLLRLRETGTNAPVILTTPPGVYKGYRKKRRTYYKPNPLAGTVRELLIGYAADHGLASWDWYTVMGGKEGMAKWKAKKMTDKRYIHFSGKGYGIQGMLLQEAIRENYEDYKREAKKAGPPVEIR